MSTVPTTQEGLDKLRATLREHEERVDVLIKLGKKYTSVLSNWKKACQTGHLGNRQKAAAAAEELSRQLHEPVAEAAAAWEFDPQEYLAGSEWRTELQALCMAEFGLRIFEEGELLVAPPILVRSQPGSSRLLLGKVGWPTLHPRVTATYLKRLNEKSASASVLQQFLNALHDAAKKVGRHQKK